MRFAATLLRKSLGSQQQAVPLPDGAAWKPQWVAADDQLLGEALLLISSSSLATDELSAEEFEELVDYFKAKQAHPGPSPGRRHALAVPSEQSPSPGRRFAPVPPVPSVPTVRVGRVGTAVRYRTGEPRDRLVYI